MVLTAIVHVFRAVCRLTSVLLVFNLPHDPEHTDSGVGITKQPSVPTDIMVVHISSHTIRIWVHNPFPLVLLKLTSNPENWAMKNEKGGSQKWISGNIICAFCSIFLSCFAVSTGDPALFLLPILSQCSSAGTSFISKALMKNKGMVGMSLPVSENNGSLIFYFFFFLDNKRKPQKEKNGHQPRNRVGENVYGCWQTYCAAFPC